MEEKIVVCQAREAEGKIQPLLDEGWKIKGVTPENVSTGSELSSVSGDIIFILFKHEELGSEILNG